MRGTILIGDGQTTSRILLKAKLAPCTYDIVFADTAAELIDQARLNPPSLIVAADTLTDTTPFALTQQLRAMPGLERVPLIVMAYGMPDEMRLTLLQAGADEVFAEPVSDVMFQARVRSLIRAQTGMNELSLRDGTSRALGFAEAQSSFGTQAHAAVLAPEPETALTWQTELAPHLQGVKLSAHGYRDRLSAAAIAPGSDVFVIGLTLLGAAQGLRLLADLRANPVTRHAGVLAILDRDAPPTLAADALDLGAADVMMHGFDARELSLRLATRIAQKQTEDRLRHSVEDGLRASVLDPMTGLFNRRYALPYLGKVVQQAQSTGRDFAVMLADLDHFKSVNDRFGHAAGDAVLIEAAERLKSDMRAEDLIARMGGEEFLIVLPDTSYAEAQVAAERLRRRINATPFKLPHRPDRISVTISIGVAISNRAMPGIGGEGDASDALLKLADDALYGAKGAGRDQVALVNAA